MAASEVPERLYMDEDGIKWRHGKPDYSLVNKKYLREKTKSHKAGSLEKIVENLVKTWEMESSHKIDAKDWKSVDPDAFRIITNGGKPATLDDNVKLGNYNLLMADCPLYDAKQETNESSHQLFRNALPGGFPWEVLEVQSGPPTVSFTWRHWGTWEGAYKGVKPTGEELEMYGSCVAKVTSDLKIQILEVYYDPNPMIAKLLKFDLKKCPFGKESK